MEKAEVERGLLRFLKARLLAADEPILWQESERGMGESLRTRA